jgi:hypothetical protein
MLLHRELDDAFWLEIAARAGLCDRLLTDGFRPSGLRNADFALKGSFAARGQSLPAGAPTGGS